MASQNPRAIRQKLQNFFYSDIPFCTSGVTIVYITYRNVLVGNLWTTWQGGQAGQSILGIIDEKVAHFREKQYLSWAIPSQLTALKVFGAVGPADEKRTRKY
ncbi:hypothetical protein BT96DRAFT_978483 [Gymnopus androsaceus JB14]|uniref:Uncharacterized protein n=1 Tax=Gymnopus androsaceus JB14 TaxID=1447944 RepID=A0A6A4H9W8_9AGAR|nr:hypothetical protein BT96DRAFT_978483 [Gymnopus androsaceus JB14]